MERIRMRRLLAALGSVGLVTAATPAVGQASFSAPYTTQCSGANVVGIDGGAQSDISSQWRFEFEEGDLSSPLSCAGKGPRVAFALAPNSEALEDLGATSGVRNPEYRLTGIEEPPTLSQWTNIDLGDNPGHDSGLIRQTPVASTAIVPIVRLPQGCPIPAKEATKDGRFSISNALIEQVFAGKITTWGQLLPDIQSSCATLPIKRVVPAASDGTTFVFKQWLATIDPKLGWEESSSLPNPAWPNDSGATQTVRSEAGDENEATTVEATDGSIGFSSLPQARDNNFGIFSPENPEHFANGQFWLSVENGAHQRVEPTRDPKSGADNVHGANCDNPTFNYTPSGYDTTVTPVWRYVSAAGSKTGWPICTLAYNLAWDDSSTVYGNTSEEQATQRTVKDYLAYVLGAAGQAEAKAGDYSPLSPALLADARDGQSRIGWNKTPGSKSNTIKAQIAAAAGHCSH